jgi:hypothetical protein
MARPNDDEEEEDRDAILLPLTIMMITVISTG